MSDVGTTAPPQPPQAPPPVGTPAPPNPPEPPKRGAGAAAGIVLIVLGALILVGRFVPTFPWWALWPLIIVGAGVVQAVTPGKEGWSIAKLFDGLVTASFGGVFLAITTGYVGWDVWGRIITFWPVLIISIGLEILSKALHASWPKVIGSLAIIAALAYSVALSASGAESPRFMHGTGEGRAYSMSESVGSIDEADLTLEAGAASVDVGSGSDLVGLDGRSPFGEPVIDVDRTATPANVDVQLGDGDQVMMWPGDFSADFDVTLSDSVLWDLTFNVGVADFTADLSDLEVGGLTLKPGVASCDVKLGAPPEDADEARVSVQAGISSVELSIPDDAEARVEIESGLSGNNVRGGFESLGGGVWETPGFDDAQTSGEPVWLISVKSGIGSITVDTY